MSGNTEFILICNCCCGQGFVFFCFDEDYIYVTPLTSYSSAACNGFAKYILESCKSGESLMGSCVDKITLKKLKNWLSSCKVKKKCSESFNRKTVLVPICVNKELNDYELVLNMRKGEEPPTDVNELYKLFDVVLDKKDVDKLIKKINKVLKS